MPRRDEYSEVAESTPFDNSDNDFESDNVQDALEELFDTAAVSASPGFTWGASGNVTANTWLVNDTVPSNKTGRNFPLYNGELSQLSVACEVTSTFTIEIYEHDGTTYTLLATATLTAQRSKVTDFTGVSVTKGKELAAKVGSGSARNPVVQAILKGSISP